MMYIIVIIYVVKNFVKKYMNGFFKISSSGTYEYERYFSQNNQRQTSVPDRKKSRPERFLNVSVYVKKRGRIL